MLKGTSILNVKILDPSISQPITTMVTCGPGRWILNCIKQRKQANCSSTCVYLIYFLIVNEMCPAAAALPITDYTVKSQVDQTLTLFKLP